MPGVQTSGPTPWWQLPQNQGSRDNLEQSAPPGYKYDPVQMTYVRTPGSLGTDAGAAINGLKNTVPGMFGDTPGGTSGFNAGGFGAGGGGYNYGATDGGATGGDPQVAFHWPGSGTGAAAPQVGHVAAPDNTAANSAAFGRAKDQTGEITRGAMSGLRSSLAGRGMMGGGAESRGTASVVNRGASNLANVSREQAIQDSNQKADFAKMGYEGDISQRGQDLSTATANRGQDLSAALGEYQGGISQRGQNMVSRTGDKALNLDAAKFAATNKLATQAMQQGQLDKILGALKLQLY